VFILFGRLEQESLLAVRYKREQIDEQKSEEREQGEQRGGKEWELSVVRSLPHNQAGENEHHASTLQGKEQEKGLLSVFILFGRLEQECLLAVR
jgi:hypothetical protein